MSRMTEYPERVYSSGEEGKMSQLARSMGGGKISKGWLLAGLGGIAVAWMIWHFGPDFVRYMKMEKM